MARLNININDETAAALRDLADRRGITVTEAVRRAVSVYKFFHDDDREIQVVGGGRTTIVEIP